MSRISRVGPSVVSSFKILSDASLLQRCSRLGDSSGIPLPDFLHMFLDGSDFSIGITKLLYVILSHDLYGRATLTYTITEKGTVSIPSRIRSKYGLRKGAKVEFIDTQEGIVIVPVVPMENLFGVDKSRKKLVRDMVREIHEERRREASED